MVMFLLLPALLGVTTVLATDSGCVSQPISLDQKLQLNADANDHNHDGITDSSDVSYDLDNNYDTDGNKAVSENEWIARWTCAFGDTVYFARFAFNILGQGKPVIRSTDFTGEPFATGVTRAQFIAVNRQRYQLFRQDRCVNTGLTGEEKLTRILKDNNHNNDSVVDYSDIAYDLSNNYDTDKNGKISLAEWVIRWCCAYGDSAAYARYVWNLFANGADSILPTAFNTPPFSTTGLPLEQFKAVNRQRYESYGTPSVGK